VNPDGNAVGNSGVILLEHSVLIFDTHFTPEAGNALLAAVRALTDKPVRYVVNSHGHASHTHGNQVFAGAHILSSTNARRAMLEVDKPSLDRTLRSEKSQLETLRRDAAREPDLSRRQALRAQVRAREEYLQAMTRLVITPATAVTDGNWTLVDGKPEIRVLSPGTGHTDGDIVLHLPEQKIVFAGCLFFNQAVPNVQDAHMLEWIRTLDALLKLDADVFVPGHGPAGTKQDVGAFLRYLEDLKSVVQEAVDRGDTVEQAVQAVGLPGRYASYRFQNLFPSNVQKMYSELKALQLAADPGAAAKPEAKKP